MNELSMPTTFKPRFKTADGVTRCLCVCGTRLGVVVGQDGQPLVQLAPKFIRLRHGDCLIPRDDTDARRRLLADNRHAAEQLEAGNVSAYARHAGAAMLAHTPEVKKLDKQIESAQARGNFEKADELLVKKRMAQAEELRQQEGRPLSVGTGARIHCPAPECRRIIRLQMPT